MNVRAERKSPVRLNLEEQWKIACFLIENRNILRIEDEVIVRVSYTQSAKECNNQKIVVGKELSASHMQGSLETYFKICELTKSMPFQTPQDTTVECDRLKVEIAKKENEVREWAQKSAEHSVRINELSNVLHKISQLIPANIFGMKKLMVS